jgi:N-acylglucosamine-6-phosphate 2-epimerase
VSVPLIGLVKVGTEGVFITPTLADCRDVAATGCEIVALDGTRRPRPDGLTLAQTIAGLKDAYPDVLVMADCGSALDAAAAQEAGADVLGTTLAGYTGERPRTAGPDWECVDEVVALAGRPVFVEGRIHSPADAAEAIRRGAAAVVVGTAITHPASITTWFAVAVASVVS